jgi:methyltransferase (TIGR00027 family)
MDAGQVSETARRVAAYRQGFDRVASPYGAPDDDRRLEADVAAGVEVEATPMARYLRARTAFFDRVVTGAIDAGITQVVAVGAGYDGRSLRYAKPGVAWFELDHPATQADKRVRLERLGITAPALVFAAADFAADDVATALAEAGHDADRATLFTCEGVAGYLAPEVRTTLLTALADRAAPGSRLAVTLPLEPDTDEGREARSRLGSAVSGVGEPLHAAVPRDAIDGVLAEGGWRVERATDPAGVPVADSIRTSAFVVAAAVSGA